MGRVRARHPLEAESLVGEGGEQPAWTGKQNRIQRWSLLLWLHPRLSSTGLTGPCRASAPGAGDFRLSKIIPQDRVQAQKKEKSGSLTMCRGWRGGREGGERHQEGPRSLSFPFAVPSPGIRPVFPRRFLRADSALTSTSRSFLCLFYLLWCLFLP